MARSFAARRQDPVAAPAIAGATAKKAARTVTVACRIPNGLTLQCEEPRTQVEQTRNGQQTTTIYVKVGDRIIVAGPAYPNGQVPNGFKRRPDDADGFALTHKVPADFWERWLEQHKDMECVKNNMIFAFPEEDDVYAKASELKDVRSGFEALDPDSDPRVAKPVASGITPNEKAVPGEG